MLSDNKFEFIDLVPEKIIYITVNLEYWNSEQCILYLFESFYLLIWMVIQQGYM